MCNLSSEEWFFLRQMSDPKLRLRESVPHMSDTDFYDAETKRRNIDKLINDELLSGQIIENYSGSYNYSNIILEEKGRLLLDWQDHL